ncbi:MULTISPECIES: response regulator transcription factor [unclassified Flavobacterium]|uniref:response regulator transcription factor n=1 Tax=unclassified Flavobacterium TaxID=196869 RepID=UPI001F12E357|nr:MULTISPECIES: response regulator transcription factor [unclassified Flavobacterium]UMY65605.1 response regulator transcription factor [Flavobacterium sp. HJ-32-4]
MDIKVAIIEDEQQIRESLAVLINGSLGFSCTDVYATAEEALIGLPGSGVDVVLTDIHLPGKSGIECVAELKPKCPSMQFMMCTAFEDTESVFSALKAGATGYLTKTTQPARVLEAIIEVYQGGSPMSSHIARKVVASFSPMLTPTENGLSVREREILDHLSRGLRYKEIAGLLFISVETVRTHIRNIYEKLQVRSRTEALNKLYGR